ncbi:TPA: DUF3892 domain-containing protein [Raoultella ornithinolytica]|jgi:hypothetical protein|uniref:DUF3892 domain-containing protein n=1 Tax=Klebsiella/Raoultella group TaxID=2890311 RepID=UPI0024063079|nr:MULTISPECIES: DUF3892 domain-containing protein [Klebsiella/Raoultella group]EEE0456077.1 DUF3892 domain-containing protein [Salmonella enterica subsp. enterica serovar Thompson]HDH0905436.1 DUF3892 domain-containing protein [Klebsiella oxytoca]HDS6699384.1 DUF3892 domain-containing protein [Klebsiella aerogenes]MDG0662223.1 DUF3892 domain-containing protein [Klebsiella quasipneumoniae]MDV1124261.1 DUF3892 domain-containing protein [Raoultella ornithinolytica]
MVDFYISAIKMDSAGQHIESVKVHKINRDGSWNTAGSISSRKFISDLISMGKASFMTVVKNSSTGKWNLGAKVEAMGDGYITTDPNKTKLDNLGNLPKFV